MKFALKILVAAVAIATIGTANAVIVTATTGVPVTVTDPSPGGTRQAELNLIKGTGGLYFSNGSGDPVNGATPTLSVGGLVGALNVADVKLAPVDGAQITELVSLVGGRVKTMTRSKVQIDAAVTSLTAETTTGQINLVQAFGGAVQTAAFKAGVLEGGTASVTNLRIDLVNKKVFADLLGNAGTTFVNNQPGLHLWNISTIIGPTSLPPAALLAVGKGDTSQLTNMGYKLISSVDGLYTFSAENILSGLKVTPAGFDFFADALGLTPNSTGNTTLAGVNSFAEGWGSLKSSLTFTVREVPEPSTYALMAAGLIGVAFAARRRRAS